MFLHQTGHCLGLLGEARTSRVSAIWTLGTAALGGAGEGWGSAPPELNSAGKGLGLVRVIFHHLVVQVWD